MSNKEPNIDDDINNLYIIRCNLANIKMENSYFKYFVENIYLIRIYPWEKFAPSSNPRITNYAFLDVYLYELSKDTHDVTRWNENYIRIEDDSKFKYYQPIQYAEFPWNNTGKKMPILQLCELIKYLHRLADLNPFA